MAESVLIQPWLRIKRAYSGSAAARFFDWWSSELGRWVPAGLREALVDRHDQLSVELDNGTVTLRQPGAEEPALALAADVEPAQQQADLARYLARFEVPPRLIYAMPGTRVLSRRLTLPAAAEDNLRQVLGFELDRQTPFRGDQVYFDFRIAQRDLVARQLQIDLALTPRVPLDADLERLTAAGVALDGVDSASADGTLSGLNLLPPERRAARPNLRLRLNLALAAVALILLGVVMAQSLSNREAAIEKLRVQVDKAKREAQAVADLRRTLTETVEGANFLNERRRTKPVIIELLRDINQRLPDDTYLQRFSYTNGEVQIQGLSTEASKLVPLLQQSQLVESPAVQGAIMPDVTKKKEQFVISAKPKARPQAAAAAAPEPTPTEPASESPDPKAPAPAQPAPAKSKKAQEQPHGAAAES